MLELLQDDAYFEATFNTLPQVVAMNQSSEAALQRTIALARTFAAPARLLNVVALIDTFSFR